jgi:hypothetical protein
MGVGRCLESVLAFGCASGPDPYEGIPSEIELIISNERQSTATAYVQWYLAGPIRLGEVSGRSASTFQVPVRGQELRVFFVGSGRTPGDPREPDFASVAAGDRLEWTLRPDLSVFYLRRE